jgi:hypothetical protein
MNQKNKITEYVMNELGIEINPKRIKDCTRIWFKNPRQKPQGGLWLTELGFEALNKADIKHYKIRFEQPIELFENRFIIWLDNTIDCPFFLTKREIYVFGEKTAVQMILFSGDLKMWHNIHTKKHLTQA